MLIGFIEIDPPLLEKCQHCETLASVKIVYELGGKDDHPPTKGELYRCSRHAEHVPWYSIMGTGPVDEEIKINKINKGKANRLQVTHKTTIVTSRTSSGRLPKIILSYVAHTGDGESIVGNGMEGLAWAILYNLYVMDKTDEDIEATAEEWTKNDDWKVYLLQQILKKRSA